MQSSDVALDTMPKLLARNVAEFGDSPAYREKDLGLNRDLGSGEMQTTIPTRETKLIMQDLDRYAAYNKQNSVVF